MRIKPNYHHEANPMILIITEPTLGSQENVTSSKDKTPIWFLGFIINYHHDLQLFSQRTLNTHLQPQEQDLEKQLVKVKRFVHLSFLIAIEV
jgi:hypothetical protein